MGSNYQFLISAFLLCLLPFLCIAAIYLYHWLEQRLPSTQRAALDQFVNMAVRAIWLVNGAATDEQKQALAVQAVKDLFVHFGLPVPSDQVILLAVQAAMLLMKQMPQAGEVVGAVASE